MVRTNHNIVYTIEYDYVLRQCSPGDQYTQGFLILLCVGYLFIIKSAINSYMYLFIIKSAINSYNYVSIVIGIELVLSSKHSGRLLASVADTNCAAHHKVIII